MDNQLTAQEKYLLSKIESELESRDASKILLNMRDKMLSAGFLVSELKITPFYLEAFYEEDYSPRGGNDYEL